MQAVRRLAVASLTLACAWAHADTTYHVLANGSFSQDWTNTELITVNDNWSGVPSIEAYRGDGITGSAGTDPRTLLTTGGPLNVIANDAAPSTATSGGIYEVQGGTEIAGNPTIAFQGSGTADAPYIMLYLNTTGCTSVNLTYNLRDIDVSETTSNQQVVAQYRVGQAGNFAVLDGTYVAPANTGGTIPGAVVLPQAAEGQSQVQVRWMTTNAPDVDAMIGVDDIQVTGSCTGGVDNPPTVLNTSPNNGVSGVLSTAVLSVQFSEAVQTATGWFNLVCNSNPVSVNEAGTGNTRTLTPVGGLPFGASCTGTITGNLVTDVDGVTQDPLAGNPTFSFTVVADTAPTVLSTVPTPGQSNVPVSNNVVLNFSEPVATTGSWFDLTCGSGTLPVTVSGTGATRTLNPDADLPISTSCTLTLTNSLITDLDGSPDPLAGANFTLSFTTNAGATGYYSGVDAGSAAGLRSTLHDLIDDHTVFPYTDNDPGDIDVWKMVEQAEEDPTNPNQVLDIYRNRKYTKIVDRNSGVTGATNYNREHSWPNSLGFRFSSTQGLDSQGRIVAPYTDGHMLFASASDYNQNRDNKPFDNCPSGCTENVTDANYGVGGGTGVYPGQSNWSGTSVYEVWADRKGDLARAILYMDVRYEGGTSPNGAGEPDLIVTNNANLIQLTPSGVVPAQGYMGILNTLLSWHNADPPDAKECYRNEVIFSHQGNRNPFIDHPEFAACLWSGTCTGIQASACGGSTPQDEIFDNGFEN